MKIERILFPTDLSKENLRTFGLAKDLAKKLNARLYLMHVVKSPNDVPPWERVSNFVKDSGLREKKAKEKLAALEAKVGGKIKTQSLVEMGDAAACILGAIDARKIDLVVMATHGTKGLKGLWVGSVTERVIANSTCPVLAERYDSRRKKGTLKLDHILVPSDLSDRSQMAFPYVDVLAEKYNSQVELAYSYDSDLKGATARKSVMLEVQKRMANLTKHWDSRGVTANGTLLQGNPAEAIAKHAKSSGADLIVMATHGYGALKNAWLGSNFQKLIRVTDTPVLAIREMPKKKRAPVKKKAAAKPKKRRKAAAS